MCAALGAVGLDKHQISLLGLAQGLLRHEVPHAAAVSPI
jgi:hypothetical protein